MEEVGRATADSLGAVAAGNAATLAALCGLRALDSGEAGLGTRTSGLVRIAALIALDAPPATYASEVALAREGGASAEDVLGVLRTVATLVGAPKVVAAAPEIMLSLGLSLPGETG